MPTLVSRTISPEGFSIIWVRAEAFRGLLLGFVGDFPDLLKVLIPGRDILVPPTKGTALAIDTFSLLSK